MKYLETQKLIKQWLDHFARFNFIQCAYGLAIKQWSDIMDVCELEPCDNIVKICLLIDDTLEELVVYRIQFHFLILLPFAVFESTCEKRDAGPAGTCFSQEPAQCQFSLGLFIEYLQIALD